MAGASSSLTQLPSIRLRRCTARGGTPFGQATQWMASATPCKGRRKNPEGMKPFMI